MYKLFNHQFSKHSLVVCPGERCVSADDIIMQTVLGSCIAVCLYSDGGAVCGMNHFLLPDAKRSPAGLLQSDAGRYGIHAMELLINDMMKRGVARHAMKAKVFGGGSMFSGTASFSDVAGANIAFVREFLAVERIPVIGSNVGGAGARKVLFFVRSKEVLLARIGRGEARGAISEERAYRQRIAAGAAEDITFFDEEG